MAFKRSLAGPGYIILNAIRVLNIICLLSVIAACTVMLVKTSLVSNFFVFDAMTNVISTFISIFLILTEVNLFPVYFASHWPVFSSESGFLALGITMVLLGIMTLGCLNREDMASEILGIAFWRIVIAAGIVIIVFGFINIITNFIYRVKKQGVTARHIRTHGAIDLDAISNRNSDDYDKKKNNRGFRSFIMGHNDSVLPIHRTKSEFYRSLTSSTTRSSSLRADKPARFPVNTNASKGHGENEQFAKWEAGSPEMKSPEMIGQPNLAYHPAHQSGWERERI
ncbi:hypothetical protein PAAG_04383 [Paracoccidioides lutzii Pb01]|uniref:DUF7598 domain-containing protein n=1 Tax=Paracoccidioides lutzii (strain ATCC MYA-826 / Pb01) TaxID=502779 RepID=C1H0T9_PARBA|nr:hypothetical protein PAAG_04383 [Paracoccidioides lutzii Pb01]EEH33333.1 hypothetical protein PAAG_04383 [Paracoccidioides lutzii Pb01]